MKLRIASVQLNPIIGQVEENVRRATRILDNALKATAKPDLIIMPELSITGYNFKNREHITPYLELKGKGRTFQLSQQLAAKYHCHTLLGYPEKFPVANGFKIYNSAVLVAPSGQMVFNYRKSFLYSTDERWGCEESPDGFQTFSLDIGGERIKTAIGICMDLSPYKFEAPFEKYEFGNFCNDNDARLILVLNAWMNSQWSSDWTAVDIEKYTNLYGLPEPIEINTDSSKNSVMLDPSEDSEYIKAHPDKRTARYWILRFNPLYMKPHTTDSKLLIICNRSGIEGDSMYAGSSSIIRFNGGTARENPITKSLYVDFDLFGTMGQGNEGVLIRDVEL